MKFRVLKTEEDLEEYRQAAAPQIDVLFPLEYLERSRVVAFFDQRGRLSGGYMLVLRGPYRVLESVPPLQRNMGFHSLDPDAVCEVTGLWIRREFYGSRESAQLWLRMYWDMIRSRKSHFVYAYSLRKPSLGQMYAVACPEVLFQGETALLPGMRETDRESVEVFTKSNLLSAPFRHPDFLWKRAKKRVRPSAWQGRWQFSRFVSWQKLTSDS